MSGDTQRWAGGDEVVARAVRRAWVVAVFAGAVTVVGAGSVLNPAVAVVAPVVGAWGWALWPRRRVVLNPPE